MNTSQNVHMDEDETVEVKFHEVESSPFRICVTVTVWKDGMPRYTANIFGPEEHLVKVFGGMVK